MPNVNDYFPSNYLKASDIRGAEPVVTIDRVEYEPVGREKQMKAVIYFKGKEKGVVLNKTNATKIVQLSGSAVTEEWEGFRVRLYATETEFAGETVECIRIKAAPAGKPSTVLPKAPPPKPVTEDHEGLLDDSDIPFSWLLPFLVPALGLLSLVQA